MTDYSKINPSCPGNVQILVLYEQEGVSPEEIAEGLGYDIVAVKSILASHSQLYRQKMKNGKVIITDEEFEDFNRAYKQLALYSEVDAVRERALRRLRDEKLGFLQPAPMVSGGLNITLINNHLKLAKALAAKILEEEIIDVE